MFKLIYHAVKEKVSRDIQRRIDHRIESKNQEQRFSNRHDFAYKRHDHGGVEAILSVLILVVIVDIVMTCIALSRTTP